MSDLRVYFNDVEWVVAASPEDAERALEEHYGPMYDPSTPSEWEECKPDTEFTFHGGDDDVVKTFAQWAKDNGRGFLATTEY